MILDLRSPNFRNDGWIEDWRIYKNIQKYTPFLWPSDEKLENLRLHIWGNPLLLHQCLPWSLSSQASMSDGRVCPVVLRDHKDRKVEWLEQSDPKHCLSCATSGPSKIARFTALQTAEHQFCTCQRARARAVAAHWPWKTPVPASKDWWFKTDVVVKGQNIRSNFTSSSITDVDILGGICWMEPLCSDTLLHILWVVGLVLQDRHRSLGLLSERGDLCYHPRNFNNKISNSTVTLRPLLLMKQGTPRFPSENPHALRPLQIPWWLQ